MTGITPTNVDSLIHIDTISPGLRIPPNWGGCHILGHFWVNPHECTRFSSSRVYMVCWIIGIRVTPVAGFDTSAPHGNFKSPRLQFHRRSYGIPHFQTHFCASVVPGRGVFGEGWFHGGPAASDAEAGQWCRGAEGEGQGTGSGWWCPSVMFVGL